MKKSVHALCKCQLPTQQDMKKYTTQLQEDCLFTVWYGKLHSDLLSSALAGGSHSGTISYEKLFEIYIQTGFLENLLALKTSQDLWNISSAASEKVWIRTIIQAQLSSKNRKNCVGGISSQPIPIPHGTEGGSCWV
jgi:hypothetical protein